MCAQVNGRRDGGQEGARVVGWLGERVGRCVCGFLGSGRSRFVDGR